MLPIHSLSRRAAEQYQRALSPTILEPAARVLVDRIAFRPGDTVVDVGCGTGAATRLIPAKVGRLGRVLGVDVNTALVDVARAVSRAHRTTIEWFDATAYRLPAADRTANVVIYPLSLAGLSDRVSALREAARILVPGGRVAASAWSDLRENPYFGAVLRVLESRFGEDAVAPLRVAFALPSEESLHLLLVRASFRNVDVAAHGLELDLPPLGEFVPMHIAATSLAVYYESASPEVRREILAEIEEELGDYVAGQGVRVPFRLHTAVGIR